MHAEYFDPRRIALSIEIREHPELLEILAEANDSTLGSETPEFETQLLHIAAYCGVMVDGEYLQEDLSKLCDILVQKLRAKRTIIFS